MEDSRGGKQLVVSQQLLFFKFHDPHRFAIPPFAILPLSFLEPRVEGRAAQEAAGPPVEDVEGHEVAGEAAVLHLGC